MVATPPGNIYTSLVFDLFQIYCSVYSQPLFTLKPHLLLLLSDSLSLSSSVSV